MYDHGTQSGLLLPGSVVLSQAASRKIYLMMDRLNHHLNNVFGGTELKKPIGALNPDSKKV